MTDRCKNITFPQTSFAAGNNKIQRAAYKLIFKIRVVFLSKGGYLSRTVSVPSNLSRGGGGVVVSVQGVTH